MMSHLARTAAALGCALLLAVSARATPLNGLTQSSAVNATDTVPVCQTSTGCGATTPLHAVVMGAVQGIVGSPITSGTTLGNTYNNVIAPVTGTGYTITLPEIVNSGGSPVLAAGSKIILAAAPGADVDICVASGSAFDVNSSAPLTSALCSGTAGIILSGGETVVISSEASGDYFATLAGGGGGAGTINAGSSPAIAQYQGSSSTVVSPATLSGDATLAAGGALTVQAIGGKAVSLGGPLATTGGGSITLAMPGSTATFTLPSTSKTLLANDFSNIGSASLPALNMLPLPNAEIYVGDSAGQPAAEAMSGDATINASGAVTLATVNTSPGTTTCSTITTNGKGLVTSNTSASCGGNSSIPVETAKTASYTLVASDAGHIIPFNGSGLIITLPNVSSSVFPAGSWAILENEGYKVSSLPNLTITEPSTSTFYGVPLNISAGSTNTFALVPGMWAELVSDGTNYMVYQGGALEGQDTISGTSYTADNWDCYQTRHFTSASAVTVTIPSGLVQGCILNFEQDGAGTVTLTAGSGLTLSGYNGLVSSGQYAQFFVTIGSGGTTAVAGGQL
jgi:hypothetical protein